MVESVNHEPTANPPGVAEALPPIPVPTKFAVASVKASAPNERGGFQTEPGGRVTIRNQPLWVLIVHAFQVTDNDQIVAPKWTIAARFDLDAEADMPAAVALDADAMRPMMLALLVDRFKMAYHTEERPMTMYSLESVKPKMKNACPASRTWCKYVSAPAGSPPGALAEACQNIGMAQFAARLQNIAAGGLDWPVASDPSGGYTIFEALEKELGLKLEIQKRPMPVIVIDGLEEKPTPN